MLELTVIASAGLAGLRLGSWVARFCIPVLILTLPVMRDGPLDLELGRWKLALVAGCLWAVTAVGGPRGARAEHHRIFYLLGCAFASVVAAFALARRHDMSWPMTQTFLTSGLFLLLCVKLFDRRVLRVGIRAVLALAIAVCLVGLLQYATVSFWLDHAVFSWLLSPGIRSYFIELGNPVGPEGVRLESMFFHSNQFGHVLSLCFGFLGPFLLTTRVPRDRAIYALTLALICACVVLTLSRGTLLIILIELAIAVAFVARGQVRRIAWMVPVGVLALLLALFVTDNAAPFLDRLQNLGLTHRQYQWAYAAQLIPSNIPFGLGPGGSSYEILTRFPPVDPIGLLNSYYVGESFNPWSSDPHNYYLTTLLEAGVFSLVFRLWLYGTVLAVAVRSVRRARHSTHRTLALAVTIPLAAEFVRGAFESQNFLSAMESGGTIAFFIATALYLDTWRTRVPAVSGVAQRHTTR